MSDDGALLYRAELDPRDLALGKKGRLSVPLPRLAGPDATILRLWLRRGSSDERLVVVPLVPSTLAALPKMQKAKAKKVVSNAPPAWAVRNTPGSFEGVGGGAP